VRKLLNTLYVTKQGVYLARDGVCIAVKESSGGEGQGGTLLRIPIHTLEGVVCFGRVSASPQVMGFCGENRVLLNFFTDTGAFLARVQGPVAGNVLLRKAQYRVPEGAAAAIARSVVIAKISNSRYVLQRALRDRKSSSTVLEESVASLARILERLRIARDIAVDSIRGIEGEAARVYFGSFNELIVSQREDFEFRGRSRRPPLDRVNAVLSFVYTLLMHDCVGALEGVGLDPYSGFLHCDRPGRPSLALDLMEELRPVLADRVALTLINR